MFDMLALRKKGYSYLSSHHPNAVLGKVFNPPSKKKPKNVGFCNREHLTHVKLNKRRKSI